MEVLPPKCNRDRCIFTGAEENFCMNFENLISNTRADRRSCASGSTPKALTQLLPFGSRKFESRAPTVFGVLPFTVWKLSEFLSSRNRSSQSYPGRTVDFKEFLSSQNWSSQRISVTARPVIAISILNAFGHSGKHGDNLATERAAVIGMLPLTTAGRSREDFKWYLQKVLAATKFWRLQMILHGGCRKFRGVPGTPLRIMATNRASVIGTLPLTTTENRCEKY